MLDDTLPDEEIIDADMTQRMVNGHMCCAGDVAFVLNARLALTRNPHYTSQCVRDFPTFRIPDAWYHEGTISGMSVRAIYDTLEGLLWVVDGNVFSKEQRTAQWFAEMREMVHLIKHRTYYLCTNILTDESHDAPAYVEPAPIKRPVLPLEGEDSDPESDEERLMPDDSDVQKGTRTNVSFVHEMNSMFWHLDQIMQEFYALKLGPFYTESLKMVRTHVIEAMPSQVDALIAFRRSFEYDLACNEADRRIFHSRQPLRLTVDSRTILINKRPTLVDEDSIPKTKEALFTKRPNEVERYRLNVDAAFAYWCQKHGGNMLGRLPIKRIRANGTYGFTDPRTGITTQSLSLLGAYMACVSQRDDKTVFVHSDAPGFPAKRVKLLLT